MRLALYILLVHCYCRHSQLVCIYTNQEYEVGKWINNSKLPNTNIPYKIELNTTQVAINWDPLAINGMRFNDTFYYLFFICVCIFFHLAVHFWLQIHRDVLALVSTYNCWKDRIPVLDFGCLFSLEPRFRINVINSRSPSHSIQVYLIFQNELNPTYHSTDKSVTENISMNK